MSTNTIQKHVSYVKIDKRKVERGNTQDGVNAEILSLLPEEPFSLLDFPCGQGEFLREVLKHFPSAKVLGADLFAEPHKDVANFFIKSGSQDWSFVENKKFDVITCISGVMCFDNISDFFKNAESKLNNNGLFIVTNDNVVTVRDRLSFLFFGRVKRFQKFYRVNEGNWNLVLIQALWKQFKLNGFELQAVRFTTRRIEDYFLIPLALPIYFFEFLHLVFSKSQMSLKEKLQIFPFVSLFSRHYVMVGRKKV